MKYLFFDTETSGLSYKTRQLNPKDPCYPRIMQLAAILTDENFNEIAHFCVLHKVPSNITVDKGAFEAHGKTVGLCEKYGVAPELGIIMFQAFVEQATLLVGHNIAFDVEMIQSEERVMFTGKESYLDKAHTFCTMNSLTDVLKLKGKIPGKYKWPKLQEAYRHFYGADFDKAHDALADVKATIAVYKAMLDNNLIFKDEKELSQN